MKKYFSYFKFLYIPILVLTILTAILFGVHMLKSSPIQRNNDASPTERVYDYADVLTDEQEASLRASIAQKESKIGADIVLVFLNESLYAKYGITQDTDANFEASIRTYADDFYDNNQYGFDKVHGNGAILVYNWYNDGIVNERGCWLSTCGSVYSRYSSSMIDNVMDGFYDHINSSPYEAANSYINDIYKSMSRSGGLNIPIWLCLAAALISGGIFLALHMKNSEGADTTSVSTYVEGGVPELKVCRDELINKYVTSRVIQTESHNSGGHGGGGHVSSGGVSHGGGGRRG